MAGLGVEQLFDGPGQSPEDVPVLVALGPLPATLLEVLGEDGLVEVGPVLEPDLGTLVLLGAEALVVVILVFVISSALHR